MGNVLPFYFLCDVSQSMEDDGKLDAANKLMPAVVNVLTKSGTMADLIRVGILDFAGEASTVLPLCQPNVVARVEGRFPVLAVRHSGTSFTAAFRHTRTVIEADLRALHDEGYKVMRPAVFMLSDGEANQHEDEQDAAFTELTYYDPASKTGFPYYPVVIPFAVDQADEAVMKSFVYPPRRSRLYRAAPGASPAQAIAGLIEVLSHTIVYSARDAAAGTARAAQLAPKDETPASLVAMDVDDELDFPDEPVRRGA